MATVARFTGTYVRVVDDKRRLSIPGAIATGRLVDERFDFESSGGCLYLVPSASGEIKPRYTPRHGIRILLPREYASRLQGFSRKVAVVRLGDSILLEPTEA